MGAAGSYGDFMLAMRERESSNDYSAVNSYGYLGAYQFGEAALIDLGYVSADGNAYNNDFSGGFTGKDGIDSRAEFLGTPAAQNNAAQKWFALLWDRIEYFGLDIYAGQTLNGVELTKSGMIAASHLLGTGGLKDFIESGGTDVGSDAYNTRITEYLEHFADYQTPGSFTDDRAEANDLDGGRGSDVLFGRAGNDTLTGAKGNDRLGGGTGSDEAHGGPGNDTVLGGRGDDALFGDGGRDQLLGHAGNDSLDGGRHDDTLKGGNGRDFLLGGGGDDLLSGNRHNDRLVGSGGDDRLFGGGADDWLCGGRGDDRLVGGGGTDTAGYGGDPDRYTITDLGNGSVQVTDDVGHLGTDLLIGVEQINIGGTIFDIEDLL
ncbi:Ca2+-binding RTX toxin-like protein [Rhodobium orientis]|nr:hypothetical protein [Rhodobium orientis]MBB4302237.1 Ca2+-binding RTX toxin-like protein [Rhodobium orientis]